MRMILPRLTFLVLSVLLSGCYALRPSAGGGQTDFQRPRRLDPAAVALLGGYRLEVVAQGLNLPAGVTFDDQGRPHVVEAGYSDELEPLIGYRLALRREAPSG